jgi:bifunctional enzyme CysN/CysC
MSYTNVLEFLEESAKCTLLRFSTAGSVDDGKSTLIGRLLHDSKNIYEDQLESLKKRSQKRGALTTAPIELALVTDGLKAEQEQGITIDVAYRYFSTPKRRFILADSPGHEQYTRNMATGASTADLTIILIDASKGVITQTRRHSFIASLMGVPRLLVAVNKMDLVDFSEEVFNQIKVDYISFAEKLGIRDVRFIPVSALNGDNVVKNSENMPWYHGESLIDYLENVYNQSDVNLVDFRFAVQYVINPSANYRGYAGQIASGVIRVGEEVLCLPSMKKSKIKSIELFSPTDQKHSLTEARAPQSVVMTLEDQIDVGRGHMLVRPGNPAKVEKTFDSMMVWMSEAPLDMGKQYIIKHTTNETKALITEIKYKVDINSLSRKPGSALNLNEIGRLSLTTAAPLFVDTYRQNRNTGNFVLVDAQTFETVAAGMILDHSSHDLALLTEEDSSPKSQNLHAEIGNIQRSDREDKFGFAASTFWFTGLSGSGKSTVAKALEQRFFDGARPVYRLDGDNLRTGLNRDLDFSFEGRQENLRRVAEVAKLFNDAGISVICSFISPTLADREAAKNIIGAESFIEVHISTALEVCEQRDPHNLYKKARSGEIKNFTGISAPYEAPTRPDLSLDTGKLSVDDCVNLLLDLKR